METEVYKYKEIMEKLNISKNQAYKLLNSGAFPVIKVGGTYRVSKKVFDNWLHNQQGEQ